VFHCSDKSPLVAPPVAGHPAREIACGADDNALIEMKKVHPSTTTSKIRDGIIGLWEVAKTKEFPSTSFTSSRRQKVVG
jgi:hypothetical protein